MKKWRDLLLGGRSEGGHLMHGSDDTDRSTLQAHMPLRNVLGEVVRKGSRQWQAWMEYADLEGWSYQEAVDEWFSPEM